MARLIELLIFSEAIKHWSDTYKQENVFELLVTKECEELAA